MLSRGFNVSNLKGIKWRMIDIDKNYFYSLQNVLKCTVCKKCYMTLNKIFLEKYQNGFYKKAEFFVDFKFLDADLNKCP
jgi:hypothetical protein